MSSTNILHLSTSGHVLLRPKSKSVFSQTCSALLTLFSWRPVGNHLRHDPAARDWCATTVTPAKSNAILKSEAENRAVVVPSTVWYARKDTHVVTRPLQPAENQYPRRRHSKRATVRQKYASPMLAESSLRPENDFGNVSTQHTIETLDLTEHSNVDQRRERSLPVQSPYLGDTSNLLAEKPTLRPDHENTTVFSTRLREQVLQIPGVVSLPSELVFEAYADMYFEHLCHRFPVVEREDLFPVKRSIPLCQAICMVGSMLRQPRGEAPLAESEQYYTAAKMLIHLDYESDFIAILKTMCLLMTWNIKGHLILTFDCAWQWLGMACRLLNQMGLHLNQTYTRMSNPKITRRIAWCIFVSSPKCVNQTWVMTGFADTRSTFVGRHGPSHSDQIARV